MKRKKKKSTRNDLSMAYRIESLPKRIPKREFFDTLIEVLQGDRADLPEGWNISWRWQNSKKQKWREDSFGDTVKNSRGQFVDLMLRRLRRDLAALDDDSDTHSKRIPTAKKRRKKNNRTRKMSKVSRRGAKKGRKRVKRKHKA